MTKLDRTGWLIIAASMILLTPSLTVIYWLASAAFWPATCC